MRPDLSGYLNTRHTESGRDFAGIVRKALGPVGANVLAIIVVPFGRRRLHEVWSKPRSDNHIIASTRSGRKKRVAGSLMRYWRPASPSDLPTRNASAPLPHALPVGLLPLATWRGTPERRGRGLPRGLFALR
jgi:hypothetical protein